MRTPLLRVRVRNAPLPQVSASLQFWGRERQEPPYPWGHGRRRHLFQALLLARGPAATPVACGHALRDLRRLYGGLPAAPCRSVLWNFELT